MEIMSQGNRDLEDSSPSRQSVYTPKEVAQYLAVIGVHPSTSEATIRDGGFPRNLETLTAIVRGHLVAFQFENTQMHYTQERQMDISAAGLFQRLVVERKGGSFCFGLSLLLLEMLRGLGFRVRPTTARVNLNWKDASKAPSFLSFESHFILLVQPFEDSTDTYLLDGGFGDCGLVRPMPLVDGAEVEGIGRGENHRLTRTPGTDAHENLGNRWSLEVRQRVPSAGEGSQTWRIRVMYDFSASRELHQEEIGALCARVVASVPTFRDNLICMRYVAASESGEEHDIVAQSSIDGLDKPEGNELCRIVFAGREVQMRRGSGEVTVLKALQSELDRVRALREILGIADLGDGDAVHVEGTTAALRT